MTAMAGRDGDRDSGAAPAPATARELYRRKRGRNLALLLAILACCALFYAITIVRTG